MKITEARLRTLIREELIREQRWNDQQKLLREGFLDNIKKIYQNIVAKPKPGDGKQKTDAASSFSEVAKKLGKLAEDVETTQDQIVSILSGDSLGDAAELVKTFMFKGLGSLSQTKYDLKLLNVLLEKVADTIDSDPEQTKKMVMSVVMNKLSQGGSENTSLVSKKTEKSGEAFSKVANIFSGLSQKVTSDVNVLQASLPTIQSGKELEATGITNASVTGVLNGGLGSLSQTSKDLMMLSNIFASAAKTIESSPEETQKKMEAAIKSKLGKATSAG